MAAVFALFWLEAQDIFCCFRVCSPNGIPFIAYYRFYFHCRRLLQYAEAVPEFQHKLPVYFWVLEFYNIFFCRWPCGINFFLLSLMVAALRLWQGIFVITSTPVSSDICRPVPFTNNDDMIDWVGGLTMGDFQVRYGCGCSCAGRWCRQWSSFSCCCSCKKQHDICNCFFFYTSFVPTHISLLELWIPTLAFILPVSMRMTGDMPFAFVHTSPLWSPTQPHWLVHNTAIWSVCSSLKWGLLKWAYYLLNPSLRRIWLSPWKFRLALILSFFPFLIQKWNSNIHLFSHLIVFHSALL